MIYSGAAGNDLLLAAADEIRLLAARNTADQKSTNRSSSASVGISIGTDGLMLNVGASGGRGNADGSDLSHTPTKVGAGGTAQLISGSDATLKGATVAAKQIVAQVGGDLLIESLQDSSSYASKQQSLGVSVSVGYGKMSGSLSAGQSKIASTYASVNEQSGIKAGDGGFQVNVAGNTTLTGGAVTSTQTAVDEQRNRFETGGELTLGDIQNHAEYTAKATSVSLGAGTSFDGKLVPQGSSAGVGNDAGKAQSMTLAAISGIAGNKEARTGDQETGIGRIFDAEKVQREITAQVGITQSFGQQASQAVGDYAAKQMSDLRARYAAEADPEKQKALQAEVDRLRLETHVLNVLIGGVTGLGGSALARESLAAAAEEMRQITIENSRLFDGITDGATTLTNIGASVGGKWDLDPTKTGGTRVDLDGICGKANERCKKQEDASGQFILDENGIPKLELNAQQLVQFDAKDANNNPISLATFLETPEGQKMSGLTGGIQGMKGTLFGVPYAKGSWQDKLIEAFGGTHDIIGGQATGLYDGKGNIRRGMTKTESTGYDILSGIAIVPSAPFAMAELLPPELWKAISILLGAAK
jgi:filamentous hemagglutinin